MNLSRPVGFCSSFLFKQKKKEKIMFSVFKIHFWLGACRVESWAPRRPQRTWPLRWFSWACCTVWATCPTPSTTWHGSCSIGVCRHCFSLLKWVYTCSWASRLEFIFYSITFTGLNSNRAWSLCQVSLSRNVQKNKILESGFF